MNIDIQTIEATLKGVKLNTEGSQDNPTSRTDLSFECLAEGNLVKVLVGCKDTGIFWNKEKQIQLLGVTSITSRAELKNATMEFGGLKIQDVKVRKINFQPINGKQIILNLVIQVHHTGEELMALDKLQMVTNVLKVYSAQDDLFPADE